MFSQRQFRSMRYGNLRVASATVGRSLRGRLWPSYTCRYSIGRPLSGAMPRLLVQAHRAALRTASRTASMDGRSAGLLER